MAVKVDLSVFSYLFAFMTVSAEPSPVADLDAFRWRNRLVVSFISEQDREMSQGQRNNRRNALAEWRDRELVLVEVGPQNRVLVDGVRNNAINGAGLRDKLAADAGSYVAVLVSKDGSEKFRSDRAIANDMLFARIDAMPMRQREMRRKQAAVSFAPRFCMRLEH